MKNLDNLTLLILSGALAWLLYVGIPSPWGIVSAIVLLLFAISHPVWQRSLQTKYPGIKEKIHLPVLCFVFLAIGGCLLTIMEEPPKLTPFYVLIALGGIVGVITWVINKGYRKPIKQLWKEDLYLISWEAEIVIIIVSFIGILKGHESFSCFTLLFLLDIVNQLIMNKHAGSTTF